MRALFVVLFAALAPCSAALADPCEAPLPSNGTPFSGTVRYIVDGDGFCVGKTNNPGEWIEVRIADFYGPELKTPEGKAAKAALNKIIMGKEVRCLAGRKSYDRTIARCTVQGFSLGDVMRRAGVKEGGNR